MSDTKEGDYTYDVIHRDSFPRQILIRYSNSTDSIEDTFDSVKSIIKTLDSTMESNIFINLTLIDNE